MARLPAIYTIQASDTPQHSARLQEILQNLKDESRIENFTALSVDQDLVSITKTIKDDDLVIILLSRQLESQKDQIEHIFRTYKASRPKVRVAEIIVDNINYDNDFITFPADLIPVRDRDDMDDVWSGIGKSLKDMFPVKRRLWMNYAKYAAIVLLAIVLIRVGYGIISGSDPEARFTYYVGDADRDTISSCYPPCIVRFINESQNYETTRWNILDSVFTDTHLRLEFLQPGDVEISLTAFKKNKSNIFSKNLLVNTPPIADFDIRNNGCTAPCRIEFANTSSSATDYAWDFGNGQTSQAFSPNITYATPDEYIVKLNAINNDGISAVTQKTVTVIPDNSPFADFTYTGTIGRLPRQVTFTNKSQNADNFIWQFPGGSPSVSTSQNQTVTYNRYDTFSVTLIARNNDGTEAQKVEVMRVRPFLIGPAIRQDLQAIIVN